MAERFIEECVAYVTAKFPARIDVMGSAVARDAVRRGINRAERYGIDGVEETRSFLDLEFQFGPDFDTRQDMAHTFDALQDPDLTPDVRLALIDARLEWAAANPHSNTAG